MDFALPPDLVAVRDDVADLVAKWAASSLHRPDDAWLLAHDAEFDLELGRRGLLGITWPTEHGGHGRSELERFVVAETLVALGAPVAGAWLAERQVGPVLLRHGTPSQQERWLPDIVAGRSHWCIGVSEPDAGSDVLSMRTTATSTGSGFVVRGQKIWTSGAAHAEHCYVLCRSPAEEGGGTVDLVVDLRSPGVTIRPIKDAAGIEHFCEVFYEDVVVPADHRVGVGERVSPLVRQLDRDRGGIDRVASNRALLQHALASVDLAADPMLRQEVAGLEAAFRVARLLCLRAAIGAAPPGFGAAVKVFGTEVEQRTAAVVTRLAGAGATLESRASIAAVYAQAYSIMAGTNTVLRNGIAERILGLPVS